MTKYLKISAIILIAICTLVQNVAAQRERTIFNSLNLSGIWGGSKHSIAQFGDSESYVQGGHIGLEFGKSLFVGYTHQDLQSDPNWDLVQDQNFDLKYRGAQVGYAFAAHRAIHPIVNVELANGRARLGNETDRIFVAQPSAGLEINIFRWLHLGLEGGYRFVSDSSLPGLSDSQLSGGFGQATLRFGWSWGRSPQERRNKRNNSED
jgi:hypothetical protein